MGVGGTNGQTPSPEVSELRSQLTSYQEAIKRLSAKRPSVGLMATIWVIPLLIGWLTIGFWLWSMVKGVWS